MSVLSGSSSSPSLGWIERPGRELLRLAWPITVSMVSFATMTLTSTAFVAHIGADELAGMKFTQNSSVSRDCGHCAGAIGSERLPRAFNRIRDGTAEEKDQCCID